MQFKTIVQLLIGIVGFGIWTFVAFYVKPEMLDAYMNFVVFIVSGVVGHAIRDVLPSKEETKQEEVKQ
jgi:uncharacterized membrane protein